MQRHFPNFQYLLLNRWKWDRGINRTQVDRYTWDLCFTCGYVIRHSIWKRSHENQNCRVGWYRLSWCLTSIIYILHTCMTSRYISKMREKCPKWFVQGGYESSSKSETKSLSLSHICWMHIKTSLHGNKITFFVTLNLGCICGPHYL